MNQRVLISLLFITISAFSVYPSNATGDDCADAKTADKCICAGYGWQQMGDQGSCIKCNAGKYSTQGDTQCQDCTKPPDADWLSGEEYTGKTSNNCPWTLTCDAGKYFDEDKNSCQTCSGNTYSQASTLVKFDGTNLTNNTTCTQCPTYSTANEQHTKCECPQNSTLQEGTCKCDTNYYMKDGSCEPCPAGSTSSGTYCVMSSAFCNDKTVESCSTQFCDTSGENCVSFEKIFGEEIDQIQLVN